MGNAHSNQRIESDKRFMGKALRLAGRGHGTTSPNPMVGAVLVKRGRIVGQGWHRKAGGPHAEIEALLDARRRGNSPKGATLYVTLEPCSTTGRTPPCTDAIVSAKIRCVVVGAIDPNPRHAGRAIRILRRAGIDVRPGVLARECARMNEAFNHWIVHRTPFVTVKAAMTLDGRIATASGESKWITGARTRAEGMRLRGKANAILVGINTILADNPRLTFRRTGGQGHDGKTPPHLRRIVLDTLARTPPDSNVVSDKHSSLTTIVVGSSAPERRVEALAKRVHVLRAPCRGLGIDLKWLLKTLGADDVTSLLVEGGGEVNASFLLGGFAHRMEFFYAPKILGGRHSRKAVAGGGIATLSDVIRLREIQWRQLGTDLYLSARVDRHPEFVARHK
jgi:diaminohydroxyphosphoribosylaminopyrimidine deaminase/5-amino-6-(5-phosphoribosylamino)uracil reductase